MNFEENNRRGESHTLASVYQPIRDARGYGLVGFEALSRFPMRPKRSPDLWFREAAQAGVGVELEIRAVELALGALSVFPSDVYLSLNASPATIVSGKLERVFEPVPAQRIVLEITEHTLIDEYSEIEEVLGRLRNRGMRVAVDDAGAGYASFRHILKLHPDLIKLDISLTRGIESNTARRALAAALIRFAEETGSELVAEGVETVAELRTLCDLGVDWVQGFLLGRPAPLDAALALCHERDSPYGQ
jgi:EAL domain-containing protein (putative c-di-GMP-specific phosphodiesterase class I)